MKQRIKETLREIERKEGVKILCAVESGSRAWGFASPDSDYDVRFIYARPVADYLKLSETRDVIEWQLDEVLDVNGWDLSKALRLLMKSNPTLFEWNNSPIVYHTTPEWRAVARVIDGYFQSKAGLWHYLSTAHHNNREFLKGKMVKLKKYFYVLRPILACRWILSKGTPPPMLFSDLVKTELNPVVVPAVQRLLALKARTPEIGIGPRDEMLNGYIDTQFSELEVRVAALPPDPKHKWDELDTLFYRITMEGHTT